MTDDNTINTEVPVPTVPVPDMQQVTETPAKAVTETPAKAVTETPAKAVTETPAQAVTETPAQAVTETSAQPVTETPAPASIFKKTKVSGGNIVSFDVADLIKTNQTHGPKALRKDFDTVMTKPAPIQAAKTPSDMVKSTETNSANTTVTNTLAQRDNNVENMETVDSADTKTHGPVSVRVAHGTACYRYRIDDKARIGKSTEASRFLNFCVQQVGPKRKTNVVMTDSVMAPSNAALWTKLRGHTIAIPWEHDTSESMDGKMCIVTPSTGNAKGGGVAIIGILYDAPFGNREISIYEEPSTRFHRMHVIHTFAEDIAAGMVNEGNGGIGSWSWMAEQGDQRPRMGMKDVTGIEVWLPGPVSAYIAIAKTDAKAMADFSLPDLQTDSKDTISCLHFHSALNRAKHAHVLDAMLKHASETNQIAKDLWFSINSSFATAGSTILKKKFKLSELDSERAQKRKASDEGGMRRTYTKRPWVVDTEGNDVVIKALQKQGVPMAIPSGLVCERRDYDNHACERRWLMNDKVIGTSGTKVAKYLQLTVAK